MKIDPLVSEGIVAHREYFNDVTLILLGDPKWGPI